jgi:hypothetical protein
MNKEDMKQEIRQARELLAQRKKEVDELEKAIFSSYQETKTQLLEFCAEFKRYPCQANFMKIWDKLDFTTCSWYQTTVNFELLTTTHTSMCDEELYLYGNNFSIEFDFNTITDVEVESWDYTFCFKLTNDLGELEILGDIREEFFKIDYSKKYQILSEAKQ